MMNERQSASHSSFIINHSAFIVSLREAGFVFMKTEVVDTSETRKEIKIEIGADEVRAEFDRVAEEYARAVNVPGFRKGHAPVAVVRTRYKKDIQGDVLKRLVPGAVEQAITQHGLDVI